MPPVEICVRGVRINTDHAKTQAVECAYAVGKRSLHRVTVIVNDITKAEITAGTHHIVKGAFIAVQIKAPDVTVNVHADESIVDGFFTAVGYSIINKHTLVEGPLVDRIGLADDMKPQWSVCL